MLNDWFYSHSTWVVALAVCTVLSVAGLAALLALHRLVSWEARKADNAMTGLSYALCGGIYAVVLAFVAIGVYQSLEKSSDLALEEVNALSTLYFSSSGLPPELARHIRADVDAYVDFVYEQEWPRQKAYDMDERHFAYGWALLRKINYQLVSFEPATPGQATVKTEMLRGSNELFSARRARISAADQHLPVLVWQMLLYGLLLVTIGLCLLGPHSFGLHAGALWLTMLSVGLVFTLIIALDYPFRGELSVERDAYVSLKQVATRTFAPSNGPTAAGAPGQNK